MKRIEVFVPQKRALVSKQVGTDIEDVRKELRVKILGV
jgi:hypothetical protein